MPRPETCLCDVVGKLARRNALKAKLGHGLALENRRHALSEGKSTTKDQFPGNRPAFDVLC